MTANGAALELATRRTALRQTLAPAWAMLATLLVAVHAPAGLRAPVVILFLCFVPGAALVGLLNIDSFAVELSLTVALSVGLSGLTAGVLVYADLWSPTAVVVIVAVISLAGGLRDIGLRRRARHAAPRLAHAVRVPLSGVRRASEAGLPAAIILCAELLGRAAGGLAAGRTAVSRLGRGADLRGRTLRRIPAVRPPHATSHRRRRERVVAPRAPASPLQAFLLDELRQRKGAQDSRQQLPRSLADAQPHELADLLSWSSLQRFVTHRAIQEVEPELWYVDDLERRLRRQTPASRHASGRTPPPTPRGVWISGVSARASIPVAWRLLEDGGRSKEWRTRLALEMIDALSELRPGGSVVAAGTAYGSLAGFRRGLEARGLPYLLRVDAATAARELAPDRPTRSAAEAREVLLELIADCDSASAATPENGDREEPELVVVPCAEHLLVCEVPANGRAGLFWLSNLPREAASERLAHLVRLANRRRVEHATRDLLLGALDVHAEDGAGLDRKLALVALAGGFRKPDLPAAPAKGGVEG